MENGGRGQKSFLCRINVGIGTEFSAIKDFHQLNYDNHVAVCLRGPASNFVSNYWINVSYNTSSYSQYITPQQRQQRQWYNRKQPH